MRSRIVALVPAWNAEPFIERTLTSLALQTYPHFHVIISDDASTDATAAVCAKFAQHDERFSLIRQTRNLGWIGNSNFLLGRVDSDYSFFAFHDDLLEPAYMDELAARLDANPRASVAFSDLRTIDPDGRCRVESYNALDQMTDRVQRARKLIAREDNWWLPIHGLFRASALRQTGGLRRHFAGEFSADWPWLIQMALAGEFERVPRPLCTKVLRKESVAAQWIHPPRLWYSVAGSFALALLSARLPWHDKRVLWWELAAFCRERSREVRVRNPVARA